MPSEGSEPSLSLAASATTAEARGAASLSSSPWATIVSAAVSAVAAPFPVRSSMVPSSAVLTETPSGSVVFSTSPAPVFWRYSSMFRPNSGTSIRPSLSATRCRAPQCWHVTMTRPSV
eukprot:scaffold405_cov243-Pinguiococcus_pyrenoidosus.AAC.18